MSQLSFQYKAIGSRGSAVKGVIQASNQEEAYRKIVAAGMKPLRISGAQKVAKGLTTIEEVLRVTPSQDVLL